MICNVCEGSGFINLHQIPRQEFDIISDNTDLILNWIEVNDEHDVSICTCCGDGDNWYGEPGHHYVTVGDREGMWGPYAYNGGLCECH